MVTHVCNVVDSEANNHFSNALMSVHYIILSKRERERGMEEEREREEWRKRERERSGGRERERGVEEEREVDGKRL